MVYISLLTIFKYKKTGFKNSPSHTRILKILKYYPTASNTQYSGDNWMPNTHAAVYWQQRNDNDL